MANLGIIQYASQIDKEACRYADKVRALRQQEYDTAVVYSDREQEMIAQNERLEQVSLLISKASAFRLMMLFTAIRAFDNPMPQAKVPDGRIILVCSEDDFNIVLCICEILLYHSIHISLKLRPKSTRNTLPNIETGVNARHYALYHNLPNEFGKSVYDRIVSEMNENASTASKWIDKFIQDGRLKRTSKGNYVKIWEVSNRAKAHKNVVYEEFDYSY